MGFVRPEELTPFSQDAPVEGEPAPEIDYEWIDIAASGMRKHNPVSSLYSRGFKPDFERQEGYDPYSTDETEGYNPDLFIDTTSPEETQWIKDQVDSERRDDEVLSASGWAGVVSEVAGGMSNPILLASMFIPGGGATIMGRAAFEAGIAASAEVVSETALHSLQETRTIDQSMFNIAAAAVVAGTLGGVIAGMSRKQVADIELKLADEISQPEVTSVGAMSSIRSVEEMTPKMWGKILSKAAKVTSLGQAMTSKSAPARDLALQLAETPYTLRMNKAGIETPVAIETMLKRWDGPLAEAIQFQKDQFKLFKKAGGGNYDDFRIQVGRAMRRDDSVKDPFVSAVAKKYREKIHNPLKEAAQASKLLPEDITLLGAKSYFSRVYNSQKIKSNQKGFDNFLASQFMAKNEGLDIDEALEIAQEIRGTILGLDYRTIPDDVLAKASALKERVLDIDDDILEPWLMSDVETVSRQHLRQMSTEIEFANKFEGKSIDDLLTSIKEDYSNKMSATSGKESIQLSKEMDRVVESLKRMHGRLLGITGRPDNPSFWGVRLGRVARQVNLLRLLGGMTLSAIPDMARPILVNGLGNYVKSVGKITMNPRAYNRARKAVKRFGVGVDMVLDGRLKAYSELDDSLFSGANKIEQGLEKLSGVFGKITLMSQWNATMKQLTGVMSSDSILKGIAKGRSVEQLAQLGISEQMSKRIIKQAKQHGDLKDDFNIANSGEWTDREAAQVFESAVLKEVDTLIVTPGIGDKNVMFDSEWGKTILQFKSFGFAATNRMLLSGMDPREMRVINFMLISASLGAMSTSIKLLNSGHWDKRPQSATKWVAEGIDRSGVIGIFAEPLNMMAKFAGEDSSRYATRSFSEMIIGPSLGLLGNIGEVGVPLAQGLQGNADLKESDLHHVRKLLPYNNLFYTRWILDQSEDAIAKSLGAQ